MGTTTSLDERRSARDELRRGYLNLAACAARNAAYLAERAAAGLTAEHYSTAVLDLIAAGAGIADAAARLQDALDT